MEGLENSLKSKDQNQKKEKYRSDWLRSSKANENP